MKEAKLNNIEFKTYSLDLTVLDEITEGHYFASNPDWMFVLDDEKRRNFGLYIEILDMYQATGEREYKSAPFVVSFGIMAAKPHKSFNELDDNEKPTIKDLIYDCNSHMGNIPVDHVLANAINGGFDEIAEQFNAKEALVITENP